MEDINEYQEEQSNPLESTVSTLANMVNQLANSQEAITSKLAEVQNSVNERFSQAAQEVERPRPSTTEGETDSWWEGFSPDAKKAVKTEVSQSYNQLKAEILAELKNTQQNTIKEVDRSLTLKNEKEKYDTMAFNEFPQINDQNHPFFKEFRRVFLEKTKSDEKFASNPSALYDAARLAYANMVHRGELVPDSFKDEARRLIGVHDSTMPAFRSKSSNSKPQLTDDQKFWARQMGITEEEYVKNMSDM